jgi:UDP-sugar transporter A1/2/3
MYFFGMIFGLVPLLLNDSGNLHGSSPFAGFNLPARVALVTLAASGLSVSFILKYLDNVAKCFMATFGMIFVAVYEKNFSSNNTSPTLNLVLGIILTGIALEQYHV